MRKNLNKDKNSYLIYIYDTLELLYSKLQRHRNTLTFTNQK